MFTAKQTCCVSMFTRTIIVQERAAYTKIL